MKKELLTRKQKRILIACSVLLCAVVLFASLYAPSEKEIVATPGALADALKAEGYTVTEVIPAQISAYSDSDSALMMNAAAAYPLVQARDAQFTPYYLSTVVIAVDKTQTQVSPDSWEALLSCKEKIAVSSRDIDMVNVSLIYTLGGENAALRILYSLQKQDRLVYENTDDAAELFTKAPIAVLTDDEAAYLIKHGYDLDVNAPIDGTLSMPCGIYESTPAITLSPKTLLEAGLRLPTGECDLALYPADYSHARVIDDYQSYGQTADNFFPRFRREVLGVRRYTTANGFEHQLSYLFFAFGICIWAFSLYMRTADKRFQKILILQAAVLLFWMLLRYLKLIVYGNVFFLWYLYYLPKLFSPLLFVYACRISTEKEHTKGTRRMNVALAAVSSLLLILVFTNNMHQLVFRFSDKTILNWVDDYSYYFGYYLVMGWSAFLVIYGFYLLFRRVRQAGSPHMIIAPLIALGLLAAYGVGYALKVPAARESELAFVVSLFILILWELCLDTGLFQTNQHYSDMFSNTRIPIWILDNDLQTKNRSICAGVLPLNVKKAIIEGDYHFNSSASEVFDIMDIHGGYAVWKTDITRVLTLQEKLRWNASELEEQNRILRLEADLKKDEAVLRHRQNAVADLETVLFDRLKEIRILSEDLSDEIAEKDKNKLIQIKLLTGFCKRIGMLMLSDEQEGYIQTATLGLLIAEAAIDVSVADIDCKVYYADEGRLPIKNAAEMYSFFSHFLIGMAQQPEATVFCRLMPEQAALCLLLIVDVSDLATMSSLFEESDFPHITISVSCDEEGCIIKAKAGGYMND